MADGSHHGGGCPGTARRALQAAGENPRQQVSGLSDARFRLKDNNKRSLLKDAQGLETESNL
jgi:hypothetical protein